MKPIYTALLVTALPMAAAHAADYQYGYAEQQVQTTDTEGNVSQTTVKQTWTTQSAPATDTSITDVNAPADAQPVTIQPSASTDETAGQHSADWYQSKLQLGERYVFNPETGKLELAGGNKSIQELNAKALQKKTGE